MVNRERRTKIDPAVAGMLNNLHQKQARRGTPQAEDRRQAEQRRQALRNRIMYDLPPEISAQVKTLAVELDCPESQVAALLIWRALAMVEAGEIRLDEYRFKSRSLKKKFNLQIPSEREK